MDKTFLIAQLGTRLRATVAGAVAAAVDAGTEARTGANRAVNLARAHSIRTDAARVQLDALDAFHPKPMKRGETISLGAIVEVENGEAGRTLFLAPVGAGEELTGPDGDGIFQVVTPVSPFGKALLGKRVGDIVEVMVAGDLQEWTVTYAA